MIQTLEDMLRAYPRCWWELGYVFNYAKLSYNNTYHSSIGVPPWCSIGGNVEPQFVGVRSTERDVEHWCCAAQDHQDDWTSERKTADYSKSVEELHRLASVQSWVPSQGFLLLKVSPWNGLIRFRKKVKLSPKFIRPFRDVIRVGKVTYHLDLHDELI